MTRQAGLPPPLSNTRDTQATEPLNGELSESLQQGLELVMKFFLALGEPVDAPAEEEPQTKAPPAMSVAPKAAPMATRPSSAWGAGSVISEAILGGLIRNWFLIHARKSRRWNTYADEG